MKPQHGVSPTLEQLAALEVFKSGGSMVLTAGAGTGKTSTLRMLADSAPNKKGLYLAFNSAIVEDARAAFPRNVTVKTSHALAFATLGREFKRRIDTDVRIPNGLAAARLGITSKFSVGKDRNPLTPASQARLAIDAVMKFCSSDSIAIDESHVEDLEGLPDLYRKRYVRHILEFANEVWADLQNPEGTRFRFHHDVYVKLWSLSRPALNTNFILYDEAQDSNPAVTSVINDQLAAGTQIVVVGDSAQSIYGWRGAVNAMTHFELDHVLRLTKSFRFGPDIAKEANKWLTSIDSPLRLTGNETLKSTVVDEEDRLVDAILCRTNGGTIAEVFDALEHELRPAIVGGSGAAIALAKASRQLMDDKTTDHRELCLFPDWPTVQAYVRDGDAPDLKAIVDVIDRYGPESVIDALQQTSDERTADVVISTAHKSKGREWKSVRIHPDFPVPYRSLVSGDWVVPSREERMLAYVAITRSQIYLDKGILSWIDLPLDDTDAQTSAPRDAWRSPLREHRPLVQPDRTFVGPPDPANTGKRWSAVDDRKLIDLYFSGISRQELAIEFERKQSAINARMVKNLGLEDRDAAFNEDGQPKVLNRTFTALSLPPPQIVEVEAASMNLATMTSALGVEGTDLKRRLVELARERGEPKWKLLWDRLHAGDTVRITHVSLTLLRDATTKDQKAKYSESRLARLEEVEQELTAARREGIVSELRLVEESAARMAAEKAAASREAENERRAAEARIREAENERRAAEARMREAESAQQEARRALSAKESADYLAKRKLIGRPEYRPAWVRHRRCLHYEINPLKTRGERILMKELRALYGGVVLFGASVTVSEQEREVDAIVIHPRGVFTIEQKDVRGPGILTIPTNGPATVDGKPIKNGGMKHQARRQMQLLADLLKARPKIDAGYLQAVISIQGEVNLDSQESGTIAITKVADVMKCLNKCMDSRPQEVSDVVGVLKRLEVAVPAAKELSEVGF